MSCFALFAVTVLASSLGCQAPQVPDPVAGLAARFTPYDVDGDGTAELRRLSVLRSAGEPTAARVVVLVEARLLEPHTGVAAEQVAALRARLTRFAEDLAASGYRAELVSADLYRGERHQDGRIVLGLRRFLQACREVGPLAGTVLVGHFPDAYLVRTCNWRRGDAIELVDTAGAKRRFKGYLRCVPETVAPRCDIVLADLDGPWEGRYFEPATGLPDVVVAFAEGKVPPAGGEYEAVWAVAKTFRDAFHVNDGRLVVDREAGTVVIDDATRDEECTAADLEFENAIARPEICVSRIDARGIALSPAPRFRDAEGRPRAARFDEGEDMPKWSAVWEADPELELRLLVEYFDRNHAFRTQPLEPSADRPASVSWGLGSGMHSAKRARAEWQGFSEAGYDVTREVDLVQLLAWLRRPAVFRTLRAHSDAWGAVFAATDTARLQREIGGVPWSFTAEGRTLRPSLSAACRRGKADFFFYRTLWANAALPGQGYLMVHTGCEAASPPGARSLSYDHPAYGRRQHAEAMLFYTPCLSMVARAKVFYDEPRGFSEVLAAGGPFGAAWQRYFAIEAASSWGKAGGDIGRKRSYFWSVLGDFTLRLPATAAAR